jgi:hypothetical protein
MSREKFYGEGAVEELYFLTTLTTYEVYPIQNKSNCQCISNDILICFISNLSVAKVYKK